MISQAKDDELDEAFIVVRTCQAMQCLPWAGGLYDQPWSYVILAQLVLAADAEKAELDQKRATAESKRMRANASRR